MVIYANQLLRQRIISTTCEKNKLESRRLHLFIIMSALYSKLAQGLRAGLLIISQQSTMCNIGVVIVTVSCTISLSAKPYHKIQNK